MKHTMRRSRVKQISLTLIAISLSTVAGIAFAAPFTPGDLVISRVGDGTMTLSGTSVPVFLDEYSLTGTLVQTISLPTTASGANRMFTDSGSATSDSMLTLSTNRQFLTLGGYDAAVGTASVTGTASATVNRIIGRIGANGVVDTATALTDAYSGNNFRSVVEYDGANGAATPSFYTAGNATSTGGTRLASSLDTAQTTTQLSTTPANVRVTNIFNGQLYVSSASGTNIGINTVGAGIPTTSGQTTTLIAATGTGSSPYDFVFTNASTLFVADDRTTNAGGLLRFVDSGNGSGFALANTYNLAGATTGTFAGLRGLTFDGTNNFYGISTDNRLVQATINVNDPATVTFTTLATAAANTAFRGVDFAPTAIAPTPEPGGVASLLIGFGALGLLVARRRRAGLNQTLT